MPAWFRPISTAHAARRDMPYNAIYCTWKCPLKCHPTDKPQDVETHQTGAGASVEIQRKEAAADETRPIANEKRGSYRS
jgi:hypothetical protein